jgi:YbbR domain-containing protein
MAYHPFRHLGLKFLSVAVALGLWFVVAGEQSVERSLRAPLELRNRPEKLELVENPPTSLDVRVRGTSAMLSQLNQGDVIAILDLSSARPGRRFFHLSRTQVRAPFGVEVVEVTPGTVSLKFETSQTKRVPVVPVVEGDAAEGYLAGKPTVSPESVEVTGPDSALERLKEATTEPVLLAGARGQVRETVAIGVPDASLRLNSAVQAVVTIPVAPLPVERTITRVPIHLRSVSKPLTAQAVPADVAVTVRGPKDVLQALKPDAVRAFVDLAGLGPGRYNLSVGIEPGRDYAIVKSEPSTVRVRVK